MLIASDFSTSNSVEISHQRLIALLTLDQGNEIFRNIHLPEVDTSSHKYTKKKREKYWTLQFHAIK